MNGRVAFSFGGQLPMEANLVPLGAKSGSVTQAVLRKIGNSYSTYCFTDVSPHVLKRAETVFQNHSGKLIFEPLDIEKKIAFGYETRFTWLVFLDRGLMMVMLNHFALLSPSARGMLHSAKKGFPVSTRQLQIRTQPGRLFQLWLPRPSTSRSY